MSWISRAHTNCLQRSGSSWLRAVPTPSSSSSAARRCSRSRDVDVVALLAGQTLVDPRPFPAELIAARDRVARDFGLPENWLNAAPADLLDFGLPEGFVERLERHDYGESLTVHFANRFDQIHFK